MIAPFIHGFGTGGGLIVASGAQNAFVLSQGVRRNHHLVIALVCIICDALLISAGVAGFGKAVSTNPTLSQLVTWAGAGFLFLYGLRSMRSALRGGSMDANDKMVQTLKAAIITTLAVTLLNPHVYLDTIFLMGSVSSHLQGESRFYFWFGAVCASTLWWVLDTMVCVTMWTIAVSLILAPTSA